MNPPNLTCPICLFEKEVLGTTGECQECEAYEESCREIDLARSEQLNIEEQERKKNR